MMNRLVDCLLCAGLLLVAGSLRAEVFTVGSDASCTHGSVFLAVVAAAGNGSSMDEIRVATNMTHSGVLAPVAGHSLRLRGGFANCTSVTPAGRTVLNGTDTGTNGTVTTSGNTLAHTLILEDIELRNAGNNARRGGALRIEGSFTVELRNVTISGNRAGRGGGVFLDGSDGASVTLNNDTVISNNEAFISGGGIYCHNNGVVLMITAAILDNLTEDGGTDPLESGNGGGVALYNCFMVQPGLSGLRGVQLNSAARHGGGYYLRNGSTLTLDGNGTAPALVTSNEAVDSGGGIAIQDSLPAPTGGVSQVTIRNSWIDSNRAQTGAGLALITGGDVLMQRSLADAQCHNSTYCSSLSFNDRTTAATTCFGAAVFAGESSSLRLRNTYVESNCTTGAGWTFRQRLNSQIRIDSSVIAQNGGTSSPFFLDASGVTVGGVAGFNGLLEVAWSTMTGHATRTSFISLPGLSPSSSGTVRVYGSLIGDVFSLLTSVGGGGSPPPMTVNFDCLLLPTALSQSVSSIRSIKDVNPYGMVNPGGGDYRLQGTGSAAVDYCDASLGARANGDIFGRAMIFNTTRGDVFGTHDLGAHELEAMIPDAIFGNGFE